MNLKALLKRYTVDQLRDAIRQRSKLAKVAALEVKRSALLRQVAKIDRKLSKLNGNGSATTAASTPRRTRWKLSEATPEKMRHAALARYAKVKPDAPPGKPRRTISPEGRAKLAAAARARWAKLEGASEQT